MRRRTLGRALPALLLLLVGGPAVAVDGVVEINQARALAGGVTGSDSAGFPVTLTGPGSYVLTSDLVVSDANTAAIVLAGNEITIDLGGFALIGPNTCSGDGSALSCTVSGSGEGINGGTFDFVTVRNGLVRGFAAVGIQLDAYSRVEGVIARENGSHGLQLGEVSLVSHSSFDRNGSQGVDAANHAIFSHDSARANKTAGLVGDQASVFLENVAYDNGTDGIAGLFGTNVLHGNTAYNNENDGMRASAGGILTRNVSAGSGNRGFFLNAAAGYAQNMVYRTASGVATVSGGLNLFNNLCNSAGTLTACP